jgi:PKD repeat protein
VTLTVEDSASNSDTATRTITVASDDGGNDPPTADAGSDQTVSEGASVTLDGTGSSDPDGDALNYSWIQTGGPAVSIQGASTATPTFTAPAVDSTTALSFELTVTDDDGLSDTDSVTVQVEDSGSGTGTVSGVVSDTALDPIPNATVEVFLNGSKVATAVTDQKGRYTVELSPGEYVVTGSAKGYASAEKTVTVTEGMTTSADLVLEAIAEGPIVVENPAQDLDGDGLYEDVNGDGSFNIIDVSALLDNYEGATVQNNVDLFDFNGDGSVNIIDVSALLDLSQQ